MAWLAWSPFRWCLKWSSHIRPKREPDFVSEVPRDFTSFVKPQWFNMSLVIWVHWISLLKVVPVVLSIARTVLKVSHERLVDPRTAAEDGTHRQWLGGSSPWGSIRSWKTLPSPESWRYSWQSRLGFLMPLKKLCGKRTVPPPSYFMAVASNIGIPSDPISQAICNSDVIAREAKKQINPQTNQTTPRAMGHLKISQPCTFGIARPFFRRKKRFWTPHRKRPIL